jgi:DNA-binding IclR family transcriptional regulator
MSGDPDGRSDVVRVGDAEVGRPALSGAGAGSQSIATVERAADVLTLFTQVDEPTLGVTEIAAALGLSKAAVHRILTSLRGRGFVDLDESTRRYALGAAAFALGLTYMSRLDVRAAAGPELELLSESIGETATLSILSGDARIYVDQVTPAREIVMAVPLGRRFPLHAGSSSKALLAFLPESERRRIVEGPLEALTDTTLVDAEALTADLDAIRSRGYALSTGERQRGAASVAAPVLDHTGRAVGAVSVCGPAERFGSSLDEAAQLLVRAAGRVSARMGHR